MDDSFNGRTMLLIGPVKNCPTRATNVKRCVITYNTLDYTVMFNSFDLLSGNQTTIEESHIYRDCYRATGTMYVTR